MSKTVLGIDAARLDVLIETIGELGVQGENAINDYLHNVANEKIIKGITPLIPISKTGRNHARFSEWYQQDDYNLAVTIGNSLKGKAGGKYGKSMSRYYLYFVDSATGTSKRGRHKDFMARGLNNVYNDVVNGMLDAITAELSLTK